MKKLAFFLFVIIMSFFNFSVYAADQWVWSVVSSQVILGSPDTLEVSVGLRSENGIDDGTLGHFNLQGTFPDHLYGFDSAFPPQVKVVMPQAYDMTVTSTDDANVWQLNGVFNESTSGAEVTTAEVPICVLQFAIQSSESNVQLTFLNLQETYAADGVTQRTVQYQTPNAIALLQSQQVILQQSHVEMMSLHLASPDSVVQQALAQTAWLQTWDGNQYTQAPFPAVDSLTSPYAFRVLINRDESDTLTITGFSRLFTFEPIAISHEKPTWIGSPYADPVDLELLFANVVDNVRLVRNDDGLVWIPELGLNTLGALNSGEGIEVQFKTEDSFSFPSFQEVPNEELAPRLLPSSTTHFEFQNTGLPATLILKQDDSFLSPGEELGVFDGDTCVGAMVVDENEDLVLTAWEGLPSQGLVGFGDGNHMAIHWWNGEAEEALMISYEGDELTLPSFKSAGLTTIVIKRFPSAVEQMKLPRAFALKAGYPNPFNPVTHCQYQLPQKSDVLIAVFDALGKQVRVLVDKDQPAGDYTVVWDGTNDQGTSVASGVYVIRMRAGDFRAQNKVMLIR